MPYTREQLQIAPIRYHQFHRATYWGRRHARKATLDYLRHLPPYLLGGEWYWTDEAAEEAGYAPCERCGEWVCEDDYDRVVVDGSVYCSDDCAHEDDWRQCERCGEWVHADYGLWVEGAEAWYCDADCAARDGYARCDHCGEWHPADDMREVENSGSCETWCDACVEGYARYCDRCETWRHEDEVQYDEASGLDLCERCYEECAQSEHLHSYGFAPRIRFFGSHVNPLYLGVELETDGGFNRGRYCDSLMEIEGFGERWWMTEDSSLRNGVELTSHPITLEEHVKMAGMYQEISATAREYGFRSHDGGRCGLHIHVNRDFFGKSIAVQDACGYRMMRLLQRFESQFFAFSRRTSDQWCCYRTSRDYTPKKEDVKILRNMGDVEPSVFEKAARMAREQAHSQALNFQHGQTFEFRIFRGTLKWPTYYACLGLVDGMSRMVKEHASTWVESVDWYTLIDEIVAHVGEPVAKAHLEAYLDEKGLR